MTRCLTRHPLYISSHLLFTCTRKLSRRSGRKRRHSWNIVSFSGLPSVGIVFRHHARCRSPIDALGWIPSQSCVWTYLIIASKLMFLFDFFYSSLCISAVRRSGASRQGFWLRVWDRVPRQGSSWICKPSALRPKRTSPKKKHATGYKVSALSAWKGPRLDVL